MTAVYRGAHSGSPEPALTGYWAHSCSQQAYCAPVNARSSPRNPCTWLHGSLLIYRPLRDGWLISWPCWLTDSGMLNRKVVTHPASSMAQDRESSLTETSVLTTMLRRQLSYKYGTVMKVCTPVWGVGVLFPFLAIIEYRGTHMRHW